MTAVADLVGWFLVGAVVVGYGLLANAPYRTGYASARQTALLPLFAVAGTAAYGIVVGVIAPAVRSPDATLGLTVTAFALGVPAFLAMTVLPIAAHRERLAPILAERWHIAVIAYAQGAMVLIGFLLFSVMGLA